MIVAGCGAAVRTACLGVEGESVGTICGGRHALLHVDVVHDLEAAGTAEQHRSEVLLEVILFYLARRGQN